MSKIGARWVPKQLTEDQKVSRVATAKESMFFDQFIIVGITVIARHAE